MLRKILCLSLVLIMAICAVPALAATSAWVDTPSSTGAANLRSGPGTEYAVIGWAVEGDELVLLSSGENWHQVQIVKNGKIGFMEKEYITFTDPDAESPFEPLPTPTPAPSWPSTPSWPSSPSTPSWPSSPSVGSNKAWIKTRTARGTVNVRFGPDTSYGVVGWAANGDELAVISKGTQWHYVRVVKTGKIGYVSANYVTFTKGGSTSGSSSSGSIDSSTGRIVTKYASSYVNMRASASTYGMVIASLKNGSKVTILGRTGDWYNVRTGSLTGYVHKNYVAAGVAAVTTGNVNMRSGPGTSYARLRVIPKGARIEVLERGSSFSKVLYGNYTGYISNHYFK